MKRLSWKTTLFACIAGCGTAVTAAERTGVIDASKLPDWVDVAAGLATIIGTTCLGIFARDNKVTSEESGAKAEQAKTETAFLVKHPGQPLPPQVVPPSETHPSDATLTNPVRPSGV